MPFLDTPNTTMYYEISEPNFTTFSLSSQLHTVLLIHGFGGTPESDFAGQLPALLSHFRVIAPHLHGYGRSTHRRSYALSFYRDDVKDLVMLLDNLNIETVLVLGFSDGGIVITEEELASIRCPDLIMHGKRDRIVPADYARIISERIPNSQILLFDAGHAAHLRCEQEYTSAIMNFFLKQ